MRVRAVLLFCLLSILVALADEFKGVTYATPAKWSAATEGDAKILSPNGLKKDELLAVILTGALPSNGTTWEQQFADTIKLANEGGKVIEAGEVTKRTTTDITLVIQLMKLDLAPIGKHSRLYAQVSQGDQRVFITVLSNKDALLEQHGDAITELIGSLGFKSAAKPSAPPLAGSSKIPTGDTPDLFPGGVGWLPSGRGIPIPPASLANGKPVGLWWTTDIDSGGRAKPVFHIFLADGTRASNPRLGGGMLYDLAGQKAQKGSTGVGSFSIEGDRMVQRGEFGVFRPKYTSGSDQNGSFFKIGAEVYRPLKPLTSSAIVGEWRSPGTTYRFKADGTYESGAIAGNGEWAVGSFQKGSYVIDGYLVMLAPADGPSTINVMGFAGPMLATRSTFFTKH